ncbi:MAG: hypothetical protein Q9170_006617 [Blastenia crenularia]
MSQSGIRAGPDSHLCQFQGFLIQLFLPADALWNLAMAINVYLTLFKKYNAQRLKRLEWKYHILCYGLPFIVALVYLFIDIRPRGKIYGPANLWCWISIKWVALRIALVYGPAWIAIVTSFTLYAISGREIFKKRQQLRAFHHPARHPVEVENPFTSFKTTEVEITHELAETPDHTGPETNKVIFFGKSKHQQPTKGYDQYSVDISSTPISPTSVLNVPPTPGSMAAVIYRNNRAAVEANTAAWGYTKVALLFFVSLLITWVPSSMNRVYSLIHPDLISIPFTYASAVVLPLMGFWNSVIYITTSWGACKDLFFNCFFNARAARIAPLSSVQRIRLQRGRSRETNLVVVKQNRRESSMSDSTRGLASRDGIYAV